MNVPASAPTRPYRMEKRAAAAGRTRQQILDAMTELWLERWYDEITMREIAARAGVAPQTVVNHFGTKDAILAALFEDPIPGEWLARSGAVPDDVEGAIELLTRDYELLGDAIVRSLALEGRIPALTPGIERGRRVHREWVEATFPTALAGLAGAERERRLDLLACATDLYTWKLLRRDRGLSREQTIAAMRELVEAVARR